MKKLFLLLLLSLAFTSKAQTYFPPLTGTTWDTINPQSLGWCEDSIQKLYDWLETSDSKAFILLKDGKIVLEKYFGIFTADSVHVWNSAGKTLTAYCVGIAQSEGDLNIYDHTSDYLGSGWSSMTTAQEDSVKIWNQLTMTTGLNDAVSDPYCTDPACLEYLADPGTRWAYHNGPYTLLDSVLHNATGITLNNYVIQKISLKTGVVGAFVTLGYNHVFASKPRSMARFGLLLSQNGVWNGNTVCSDVNYLNEMRNTSQNLNPSYGYLTWLNGKSSFMLPQSQVVFPGSLMPNGPADVYAAEGKDGQIINVSPSQGIVLIRMGDNLGTSMVATTYNDTIWQYINHFGCTLGVSTNEIPEIQLVPNPSTGSFTLSNISKDMTVQVISNEGKLIAVKQNGSNFELEKAISGCYFVLINTPTLTIRKKLLIE